MKTNPIKKQNPQTLFNKCKQPIHDPLFKYVRIPHPPFLKGGSRKILLYLLTICILISALTAGCGYSNKSLISRKINSIYIPIFENDTFRRGVEFDLTKAVKDTVISKTNLKIVSKDYADTVLSGTIKDVNESILTQDIGDNIVESRIILLVDFKLIDRRTGRILIDEKNIRQESEFIVTRGETLEFASDEGVTKLAQTIVNLLEEKW